MSGTLQTGLLMGLARTFRHATVPGSLVTPLTGNPEAAAELAVRHFAAFLRGEAATMRGDGRAVGAAITERLAEDIDPPAGGTD